MPQPGSSEWNKWTSLGILTHLGHETDLTDLKSSQTPAAAGGTQPTPPPTPSPTPYPTPAPPTPAPTPAGTGWTPSPTPAPAPTPAPTPQPTTAMGSAVVVITTKLTGFTLRTFTLGVQMAYRSTIAAKVDTTVDKVTLVNIRTGSRRLGEQSVAAADAVHFDTSISVASTAAATAMKSTVAAITPAEIKDKFVNELKTEKESGKFPPDELPANIVALAASITVSDPEPSAGTTVTASPTPAPPAPAPAGGGGGLGGGALAAVLLVCIAGGAAGMFALQRRRSFSLSVNADAAAKMQGGALEHTSANPVGIELEPTSSNPPVGNPVTADASAAGNAAPCSSCGAASTGQQFCATCGAKA